MRIFLIQKTSSSVSLVARKVSDDFKGIDFMATKIRSYSFVSPEILSDIIHF